MHLPTGSAENVPGGSCTYFAAAASFLSPVRVIAVVGDDWPASHRAALESFDGLCLEGLEQRPGSKTFAWGGRYLENMCDRETLFTELGVLGEEPPPIPEAYRDSRFVFLANSHPEVQAEALSQFVDPALVVADTMNLWINTTREALLDLLQRVDGLIVNDEEAHLLTGQRDPLHAARAITKLGPAFVVIKMARHGSLILHGDKIRELTAYQLEPGTVLDPTGAGDAYAGGLMGHLASTNATDADAIREGMAWGTVLASFTISGFGLEGLRTATPASIEERKAELMAMALDE